MARICLVVTNGCAPDPRVERHARWLVECGHEVTIFAWDREHTLDGLSERDGYTILRTRTSKAKSSASIVRQKKRFLRSLEGQYDFIIYNDSDSIGTKNLHSRFSILDLHDIAHAWPIMQKTSLLRRLVSSRMKQTLRKNGPRFDGFLTSSPGLSNYFNREFQFKSTVVLNVRNASPLPQPLNKTIGFFGRIRDFEAMVSLVECSTRTGFHPIVAGDGPCVNRLLERYPQLDYRGPFDETQLAELMAEIDVMFAMYNPEKENIRQGALPVKMFDAAAFGRPTVTSADVPMGDFCLENKLGVVASFGDQDSISNAIEEAYEVDVISALSEEDERKKFVTLIQSILDTE